MLIGKYCLLNITKHQHVTGASHCFSWMNKSCQSTEKQRYCWWNSCRAPLQDPNQLIRASALRVLSSIRVTIIVPIMMLAIKEAASDMSPYVRKTAAHAIPKLYRWSTELDQYPGPKHKTATIQDSMFCSEIITWLSDEMIKHEMVMMKKNYLTYDVLVFKVKCPAVETNKIKCCYNIVELKPFLAINPPEIHNFHGGKIH